MRAFQICSSALLVAIAHACDSCYGPQDAVVHTRQIYPLAPLPPEFALGKRMQPDAQNASYGPGNPLAWGQLNVIHTTDTHGWLEGHILEQNYGADWGDYVSFTKGMRNKADQLGVDLLVVDTGDLHDGAGLSDATNPNGVLSNPIFDNVDYDLLTIGNHELYVSSIAYEHFYNFSRYWGDKYLTSNVEILNPATNAFEYIGKQYRYFTTKNGLRIMAFGVLYDFTGNSNVSRVTRAANVVQETWWTNAVMGQPGNTTANSTSGSSVPTLPIDLFVLLGHNPVRWNASGSTFRTYYQSIRSMRPNVPIQVFGGHSHIRDFAVYDEMTTALESGRYCETLGFFSMSGLNSSNYTGASLPAGVPHPTKLALSSNGTNNPNATNVGANLKYSRRYLDWNRRTFEFHATGSQNSSNFDYYRGVQVTQNITATRKALNISAVIGCAPQTWCLSCAPYGSSANIYSGLLPIALSTAVVESDRASIPRIIIVNSGGIRFDLTQGPFTIDDGYIVSPFLDYFQYLANVPYAAATQVLNMLNTNPAYQKRDVIPKNDLHSRDLKSRDFGFQSITGDDCKTPELGAMHEKRSGPIRRQTVALTPGYTTTDDFGSDGDDTLHSHVANYASTVPSYIGANASLPASPSTSTTVDLIFIDYIASDVLAVLSSLGASFTTADIKSYISPTYSTNSYLPDYARIAWQANINNCPVGLGVGAGV